MLDVRGNNHHLGHPGTLSEALERPHWVGLDKQPFLGILLLPIVQLRWIYSREDGHCNEKKWGYGMCRVSTGGGTLSLSHYVSPNILSGLGALSVLLSALGCKPKPERDWQTIFFFLSGLPHPSPEAMAQDALHCLNEKKVQKDRIIRRSEKYIHMCVRVYEIL